MTDEARPPSSITPEGAERHPRSSDTALTLLTSGRHHPFVSPETIYGLILFLAVIAGSDDTTRDLQILLEGIGAAVVVWFAHVVAYTTARHGLQTSGAVTLRSAFDDSITHSAGILIGPTPALVALALGAADILDDEVAYWIALLVGVILLAGLGLVAFIERGARWYVCVAGSLVTTLAGLVAISLKAIF